MNMVQLLSAVTENHPLDPTAGMGSSAGAGSPDPALKSPEISVVLPCLNEADTLAHCIEKAQQALRDHAICGEVIVADNGSSDGSPTIAMHLGARVVHVAARGYGNALMGGIAAARGRYILMADSNASSHGPLDSWNKP